jgi:hypothetical protein
MKIILLLLLLTLSFSVQIKAQSSALKAKPLPKPSPQSEGEKIKLPVRKRTELLFANSINERAEKSKIALLQQKKIADNDLEFRVWIGFGLRPLQGFVISRTNGKWEGIFLKSISRATKSPYYLQLSTPKSGWEDLWKQLTEAGFLTLPDFSELDDMVKVFDGTSYVVETKFASNYQTYAYLNPKYQRWKEAKQMLKIADILYSEFNVF